MRNIIFWNFLITAPVAIIFGSLTVNAQDAPQKSAGNEVYKEGPCEKDIPPNGRTKLTDPEVMRDLCWRDHIRYIDGKEGDAPLYGHSELILHGVISLVNDLHLTGSGIEAGIWDEGFASSTHVEFQKAGGSSRVDIPVAPTVTGRIPDVFLSTHATHVAGIMSAKGASYKAVGPASEATIHSYHFGFHPGDDTKQLGDAAANGTVVSNHSYSYTLGWEYRKDGVEQCRNNWFWLGDPTQKEDHKFGKYTQISHDFDSVAENHKSLSIFVAAGNERGKWLNPYHDYDSRGVLRHKVAHCVMNGNEWESSSDMRRANTDKGGYDTLSQEATSKNVITIGAMADPPFHPEPKDISPTDFSGFGPTDDGRIKPDLMANGSDVYSAILPERCQDKPCEINTINGDENKRYALDTGTSMATPFAAGIGILLDELAKRKVRESRSFTINENKERVLFSDEMKAALIHTALSPRPDFGPTYSAGWGSIQADKAARLIMGQTGDLYRLTIKRGGEIKLPVELAKGQPARVTAVWIDPPGDPVNNNIIDFPKKSLVNDLDIVVVAGDGRKKFYPWQLNPKKPHEAPTNSDKNSQDNVEVVDIPVQTADTKGWYLKITTNPRNFRSNEQEFALAISGARVTKY